MKLHDLRPAEGSRAARTRVGRGIAAGKGKTAGRGTKGQKARAGGSIPPWFEGGQTPLHMRIPKLRGFKNRVKIDYEIVNVGDIDARVEARRVRQGRRRRPKKGEQLTINADVLRAVGLVRNIKKPLKSSAAASSRRPSSSSPTRSRSRRPRRSRRPAARSASSRSRPRPALPWATDGEPVAAGPRGADRRWSRRGRPQGRCPRPPRRRHRRGRGRAEGIEAGRPRRPGEGAGRGGDRRRAGGRGRRPSPSPRPKRRRSPAKPARKAEGREADADPPPRRSRRGRGRRGSPDEPADAPDAVADASDAEPVTGDDTESDSAVPGDDA